MLKLVFFLREISPLIQMQLQIEDLQYNLNGSNTDGSFTVDDSNSLFSPYKILPITQGNKY